MSIIGDVELKDSANAYVDEIRRHKKVMDSIFNTFSSSVNKLNANNGFNSPAGNAFYTNYKNLESQYNEFLQLFEEFAVDYESAISSVQTADSKSEDSAASIRNADAGR